MLADSVDPNQIALEQSGQGLHILHCLPVFLLNVGNTLIQKRKVNIQVFPFKGKSKNNTVQVSFGGKNACFFWMYQVDLRHLHFTSKKIRVCGIDYHKSSEYLGR